jgi:rod shape determining protein RodA
MILSPAHLRRPPRAEPKAPRVLRYVDWVLVASTVALIAGGAVILYSATRTSADPWAFIRARGLHMLAGTLLLIVFAAVDYSALARAWRPLLAGTVLLLTAVDVLGRTAQGAQRWIPLGPFSFQPSEVGKLLLIITLAKHIDGHREITSWRQIIPLLAHAGIPILLIVQQPDLGTAMVLMAIFVAMLFAGGAPMRVMAGLGAGAAAAAPVLWQMLHDYQRRRLIVFLDPGIDPQGAGYALIQSKIAVGSGQLFGRGLLHGTQNLLHFIPEQHTDFIFTVVGEELGFAGAILMLFLFALWLWRAGAIAAQAKDRLGMLMAAGVLAMIAFHVVINVGMTVGLMPITGIPLPFISHGGSALVVMLAATGLLINIGMRRKKILF